MCTLLSHHPKVKRRVRSRHLVCLLLTWIEYIPALNSAYRDNHAIRNANVSPHSRPGQTNGYDALSYALFSSSQAT